MNSRDKGARGEREFSSFCKEQGYDTRRGQQFCGANGDADVVGLPHIHIEVKRTEKFALYEALGQAQRDSKGVDIPIVAHRKNNHKWVVVMDAEDFFKLCRGWEAGQ